ncbi:hypothetical protein M9H77_30139 [Catharanthus roseus]|uniref:Uncharacterized protein n=1 Tax=Catharanthus roseus TaxID=4058 RepID=A0ACB9ZYZ7_CATRO|nr:hypothetical protein M9H77_30139 [Catharanthus roseus]
MNWESQEAKDLLHGSFSSSRPKKIKDNDGNEADGMDHSREQVVRQKWLSVGSSDLTVTVALSVPSLVGFCWKTLGGAYPTASGLAKGVKDLRREEEAISEQSSKRDFGGYPIHDS